MFLRHSIVKLYEGTFFGKVTARYTFLKLSIFTGQDILRREVNCLNMIFEVA